MTQEEMTALLETLHQEEKELRAAGQAEYARSENDVFANFNRVAADLGLTREQVLWVYARKHMDGIVSWINGYRSQREDVRGRINDLRVYLGLLRGMVEEAEAERNAYYCGCDGTYRAPPIGEYYATESVSAIDDMPGPYDRADAPSRKPWVIPCGDDD